MKRLKALWPGWAFSALVGLLCYGLVVKVPNIQAIATVALVTFTMAYVLLIHKSIVQTSNLRREDRELDFKRRKLDWTVNWAREVRKVLTLNPLNTNITRELENYAVENEEIIDTAKIFGAEFERIVEKAAKDLWAYIVELKKPTYTTMDHNSYIREVDRSFSKVLQSALKVEGDLVKI